MIGFKGRHYKKTIIVMAVRWHVAYSLSYRDIRAYFALTEKVWRAITSFSNNTKGLQGYQWHSVKVKPCYSCGL